MSEQQQSPLFRLPRELRDAIYDFYAHEDDGLFYDYISDKLWYANKNVHQDRDALTRCCKRAAEEMQYSAMRANTITFTPARSRNDGIEYNDLNSKAGRFERLLQSARRMNIHILHHVAKGGCVTPAMVSEVVTRYPGIAPYYLKAYDAISDGEQLYDSGGRWDWMGRWQTSAAFCEAIQYTLQLASSHPRFDRLATEACITPCSKHGMMPPFTPGSHQALLAWQPDWWLIPTEADLALETYLADPLFRDDLGQLDWPEPIVPVAWYFSATAVAIDFLKRLPNAERMRIRRTLIIREDKRGAGYPESHVEGILPYLLENSKLKVRLHVGFWTNLMHPAWLESINWECQSSAYPAVISAVQMLRPCVDFLDEATTVLHTPIPTDALNIYIDGQGDESVAMWQLVKHAAGLQEAMAKSDYMREHKKVSLSAILDPMNHHPSQTLAGESYRNRFQLPCDLPASLYRTVRDITQGTGCIHFDGDAGALWEAEEQNAAMKGWSPQQFADEWFESPYLEILPLPPGGITPFMKAYELQALIYGKYPWKWRAPDGTSLLEYYPETLASEEVFARTRAGLEKHYLGM